LSKNRQHNKEESEDRRATASRLVRRSFLLQNKTWPSLSLPKLLHVSRCSEYPTLFTGLYPPINVVVTFF
jgi:hypothetical protein